MNLKTADALKAAYVLHRLHSRRAFPLDDLRYFFGKAGSVIPDVSMAIVELEDSKSIKIWSDGITLTEDGVKAAEELVYSKPEPEDHSIEVMTAFWTLHSATSFDEPVRRADVIRQSSPLSQPQVVQTLSDLVYGNHVASEGGNKYSLTPEGKAWIEANSAPIFAASRGIK